MAGNVGRPPKPTPIRILGGNAGHRPLPAEAPVRPGVPPAPTWLSGCGICGLEWDKLVTELQLQRVMALKFGLALDLMFQRYHVYHQCRDVLDQQGFTVEVLGEHEDGSTYVKYIAQRPEVSIGNKALNDMIRLGGEFGWTPSSNTRLRAPPADDDVPGEKSDEYFTAKRA